MTAKLFQQRFLPMQPQLYRIALAILGVVADAEDAVQETYLRVWQQAYKIDGMEQLQNEEGIECYEFNEGDNIIFRLEFRNDTDEDDIVPRFYECIGWDGFRVYSIDGVDMGTPWDQIISDSRSHDILFAHSSTIIVCPWFDIPTLYWNGHEHFYSNMYYKKEEKLPLPKGEYYSRFDIKIKDKTIVCNRNFKII